MKRQDVMRFYEKVDDWLDAHSFSYSVITKYVDSKLSIFTFRIKEIPLITFSIWYTCFPRENGQSTTTPQHHSHFYLQTLIIAIDYSVRHTLFIVRYTRNGIKNKGLSQNKTLLIGYLT